ncbi:pyridoxamine 5'-phosphate oxidase family protein [Alkaliphilus hydrothermalis]|uniref:Nitroimidazol reductase NimA-like FMN-containing flavoprotein (Pyridoxamine 5'-phosphate oxidase superfamily) n=1 Tax=Alkaliphilus hydrothermalis TaxID=1482730 RepID=A0ABS2NSH7_9FIRM|nr:pyridoxamine 5'-phosphate oxidase family protein [Alkaliphilus hydrothermalis]MBM7615895.1 nitroimidazol reductase NimA-like FMN-containing flavoprotein (pyridoxamine 5'-phosphate oxidase superfamily) [Alkaliphilus hydrothermalis]
MEVRRKDREINLEESKELLQRAGVGILSTVDEEGQPYGVPVNYVYEDDTIYFHCAVEGHKLINIKKNNRVCFTVYGENNVLAEKFTTTYESVVVFGRAKVVEEAEKLQALKLLVGKFSPDFMKEGLEYIERAANRTLVVKISVDQMTGKRNNPHKK